MNNQGGGEGRIIDLTVEDDQWKDYEAAMETRRDEIMKKISNDECLGPVKDRGTLGYSLQFPKNHPKHKQWLEWQRKKAELDAEFHLAIIEASHNVILLHMMRASFDLLRQGVFYNRQQMFKNRTTRDMLLDQHRAINTALQARDPVGARAAVEAHLSFVETALSDQQKADQHEAYAQKRFEHEARR